MTACSAAQAGGRAAIFVSLKTNICLMKREIYLVPGWTGAMAAEHAIYAGRKQ